MALTVLRRCLLSILVAISMSMAASAQTARVADIDATSRSIALVRLAINNDTVDDPDAVEDQLREMRDQGRLRLAAIERELETARTQVDLLGPAPEENQPAESDFIAEERARLEGDRARLNGERTRVLANIYETGELLTRLSGARVGALYRSLGERGPSPLEPAQWSSAWGSFGAVTERISRYFAQWGTRKSEGGTFGRGLLVVLAALIASVLLFWPVNRWISETFSAAVERRRPTPARRVVVAGLKMAARTAPGVIGGLVIIETLRAQGILAADGEAAARAFWIGVLSVLIVSGFTTGVFAPSSPEWRIASIDAARGRTASRLAMAVAVFFSLKLLLTAIGVAAKADESLLRMIEAAGALAIGVCVFFLSRGRLWRVDDKAPEGGWKLLRQTGRALSLIIVICALVGYVPLADFLASRIVFLTLVIGLAWLLQAMLAESALRLRSHLSGDGADQNETESNNYKFWSRLIINTGLFVLLLPAILVLFGVPAATVRDLAGQALFGFNIGGVHIPSIAKLLAALIVFVVVMGMTKLVQRGVQRGPLAHSRADVGVQNSLITLLGYAGLVIAIFASISALGVDLGNLALIAGALSVGIGFGLQSIVNNFVSGLILLFERPIKVGDWIVTTSGEGTVKKISVRSTEIETFDRSSIIVPNSELISSTVTNWTHKDKIGRFRLPVGVSYNADPELVREILLSCAKDHPLVVAYPEPFVVWNDFGASSLDFELRAFLNDISKGLQVRTDLRFTIFKALAEAGIEIPFPQTDVHIKSMPEAGSKSEPKEKPQQEPGHA